MANIPTHTIQPSFRQHLLQQRKGRKSEYPIAPYGVYEDRDPKYWDAETDTFSNNTRIPLPIQGPANWDQVWDDWGSVGQDYKYETPDKQPIPRHQLKYLKQYKGLLRDIRFERMISDGRFGKVWRVSCKVKDEATDEYQGYTLACKVIPLSNAIQNSGTTNTTLSVAVNAMLKEVRTKRLNHSNLCWIQYFISIPDTKTGFPYATGLTFTELCAGSLLNIIQCFQTGDDRRADVFHQFWFTQVVKGLEYMHANKVVHLDIQPQNILYTTGDPDQRITSGMDFTEFQNIYFECTFKLSDFGCAISYGPEDEMVTEKRMIGSPEYMAPEMSTRATGGLLATTPCDIYSLGLTLADDIIGLNSYNTYSLRNYITDAQRGVLEMCYHLTGDTVDLLYWTLHPDPGQRYTSIELCYHIWVLPHIIDE